jgi:ArsR family transcriptional regulator, arsenate/arsenite/antimonite-responsive transcriptional repressor
MPTSATLCLARLEGSSVDMSILVDGCYRTSVTPNENLAFDALSDRVRRQILSVLGEGGELTVNQIADRVDVVGRSTVSSHLRILRTSGVVKERREGRHRYYSLDTEGSVRDAFRFLQSLLQAGVRLDTVDAEAADLRGEPQQNTG